MSFFTPGHTTTITQNELAQLFVIYECMHATINLIQHVDQASGSKEVQLHETCHVRFADVQASPVKEEFLVIILQILKKIQRWQTLPKWAGTRCPAILLKR